jgi:phage gpG-like protein
MSADVITTIDKDTISPDLRKRIKALGDRKPVLEAMGAALMAIAKAAFTQSSLRPTQWKAIRNTKGQFKAPLYDTGALKQSIRVVSVSNDSVRVGSDRPYAAAHQFGSKPYVITPKRAKALFWPGAGHPVKSVNHPGLPPRPFFPFGSDGKPTDEATRRINATARAKLASMMGD